MIPPDPVPTSRSRLSTLWRWCKRMILLGVALLAVLAIFHRPLLRWAIGSGVPYFAAKAGYQIDWDFSGAVLSGFQIRQLKVTGPENGPLKSLTTHELGAAYDLISLFRGRLDSAVLDLHLADVEAEIDARPQADQSPSPPKEKKPAPPPNVWIGRIDLRNINAKVITPTGDIVVRGFTLLLDPQHEGTLEIKELIIPSARLHLNDVHGRTSVAGRVITLSDLWVMPDVSIPKLALDVEKLNQGLVGVELSALSGTGKIAVVGALTGIGTEFGLDLQIAVEDLPHTEIARWAPLPHRLAWTVDGLTGTVKGRPGQPQSLIAELEAHVSRLTVPNTPESQLQFKTILRDGTARIEQLRVQSGVNQAEIEVQASLPARWPEIVRSKVDAQWKLNALDLSPFKAGTTALSGSIVGSGSAQLDQGKLLGARTDITAKSLQYGTYRLASAAAKVQGDPEALQLEQVVVRLDDENELTVTGRLSLQGRKEGQVLWQAAFQDLGQLTRSLGLPETQQAAAGRLVGGGKLDFNLDDLGQGKLETLAAEFALSAESVDWQKRQLQNADIKGKLENGIAMVESCDLKLNESNTVKLTAKSALGGRQDTRATLEVSLGDLPSLATWLGLKDIPAPEAGRISIQGETQLALADLREKNYSQLKAALTADVQGVVWQKEKLETLKAVVAVQEGVADLSQLEFRLNPRNHLAATGKVGLQGDMDFQADLKGDFSQITDLNPWLKILAEFKPASAPVPASSLAAAPRLLPLPPGQEDNFPAPLAEAPQTPPMQFDSGSLSLGWQGTGKLTQLDIRGGGAVEVKQLKLSGKPQVLALSLETKHEGRKAEITKLHASADKFLAELTAVLSETDLSIPALSFSSGGTKLLTGTVQVPLVLAQSPRPALPIDPLRPIQVKLQMAKTELGELFKSLGIQAPVTGAASLDVDLKGRLEELAGKVSVNLEKIQAEATRGKLDPVTASLETVLQPKSLRLNLSATQPPLKPLQVQAETPFDLQQVLQKPLSVLDLPLQAQVTLAPSDLAFVKRFAPILTDIQGTAGIDIAITGTAKDPKWKGAIRADVKSADLNVASMTVKDTHVVIGLHDRKITLENVSTELSGGKVQASGGVDLTDLKNPAFDIKLTAREALLVRDDTMSQRADADITCKGTLQQAHVEGNVKLVRGRVFKEIEFIPLSLPNQLPPKPPAVRSSTAKPSAPPPFDKWTVHVDVGTKDPIRLLGNVLNGGVVVDLRARGTGAAPEIEGKVSLEGARLQLPFSRVAITKGDVIFNKDKPLDPQLDLVGDSLVGQYQVTLYAYGSALAPKTRFTSSPPLSEGDIATLLATGTTSGDLRSSEGMAANRAAFLLISQTYRKLFKKTAPRRYDEEPPRLSFSFNPLSTGTAKRSVTGTYEINPKLQLAGTVAEDGGFRGLLYYLIRFR